MLLNQIGEGSLTVNRDTLADKTADLLRNSILLEELKPNQVLAERELSEKLGVSRTPFREALRILATEGLVVMAPNLRPRVANPTLEQVLDMIDVLSSLERLAGELLGSRITDDTLSKLDKAVARMGTFPDDADELEFFNIDMDFHRTIVAATGNQQLITTHGQYNAALYRARFMSTRLTARRPLMREQHAEIVELFRLKNGTAAGLAMRTHLQQLKINIGELFATGFQA